jgi:hypothetical protein
MAQVRARLKGGVGKSCDFGEQRRLARNRATAVRVKPRPTAPGRTGW